MAGQESRDSGLKCTQKDPERDGGSLAGDTRNVNVLKADGDVVNDSCWVGTVGVAS
jgi:hypothetical protein